MDSMTIIFVFMGLIAFIPDNAHGVHAILLNTMDCWLASDGQPVPHHQPFVAVDSTYVDPAGCPKEVSGNSSDCSILLDYDDVTVEGDLKGVNLPRIPETPIVSIESIVSSTQAAKGDLLDPKPERSLVAGRFTLGAGTLHGVDLCGDKVVFAPIGGPVTGASQAVAEVAYVAFSTPDKYVTLRVKRFNSMDSGRTLVIQSPGQDTTVIVRVRNVVTSQSEGCESQAKGFDRHFEMFYKLAADEPWSHDRPVPHEPESATRSPSRGLPSWLLSILPPAAAHDLSSYCTLGLSERMACTMAQY
jgi:hypothetical protein